MPPTEKPSKAVGHRHSGGYLPTLDGWRAVAILLVLACHSGDQTLALLSGLGARFPLNDPVRAYWLKEHLGDWGVHIFFTLSGYLITSRLVREASRGRVSLKEFYTRRVFRIQPAALTYLTVVGALALSGKLDVLPGAWLSALLCYANLHHHWSWSTGHFWTLAIEEQFYLAWPLLFVMLGERRRLLGAVALTLAFSVWRAMAFKFQIAMTADWSVRTDMQAEYLMWGCAFALWKANAGDSALITRLTRPLPLALALGLMTLSGLVSAGAVLRTAGAGATGLVLMATSTRPETWLGRLLELRPVAWLGRISYSLYLWQQLFFAWDGFRSPSLGRLQSLPWNIAAALACALASYKFIEQPLIRVGHRMIERGRATTRPPLARSPATL
jgi:peptidoglycan/LPS O-acetylase OafA/YrhL